MLTHWLPLCAIEIPFPVLSVFTSFLSERVLGNKSRAIVLSQGFCEWEWDWDQGGQVKDLSCPILTIKKIKNTFVLFYWTWDNAFVMLMEVLLDKLLDVRGDAIAFFQQTLPSHPLVALIESHSQH
jgi:hypothetical protein